jgi:hypothetical protein
MTNIRETLDCKNLEEQSLEEKLDKNTWQLLIMEKKGLMSHDIRVILRSSLYKVMEEFLQNYVFFVQEPMSIW